MIVRGNESSQLPGLCILQNVLLQFSHASQQSVLSILKNSTLLKVVWGKI